MKIRYSPGYPLAGISMESTEVSVSRPGGKGGYRGVEIDRYFSEVEAILAKVDGKPYCQTSAVDYPTVTVIVALESRSIEMSCSYGEKGALKEQTETERNARHRLAFETLIKMTLDRSRVRLGQ